MKSIYVGNVAFSAPREDLQALFEAHGQVVSVRLMTDRITRRPRGYGFVEMESQAADAAIAALNGMEFFGRSLRVNEAKQRAPHRD
ncbi:MAG: RNA-binding protein [Gammaproteobacteria bacterium]|nr:RNA-binding protein [Gammaproteobacteria bacterium]